MRTRRLSRTSRMAFADVLAKVERFNAIGTLKWPTPMPISMP